MKSKKKDLCTECVDQYCQEKNSENIKPGCPADENIPLVGLQAPPQEMTSVFVNEIDKEGFHVSRIRAVAEQRIGTLLRTCLECEDVMKSCAGYTSAEWEDVMEDEDRSGGEYDGLCSELLLQGE